MTKERRVWSSEEEKKKKKHCEKSILYTVDPRYNEDLQQETGFFISGTSLKAEIIFSQCIAVGIMKHFE